MQVEKISVSLPAPLVHVETYRSTHKKKTRSEVIEEAVKLLRQELERTYSEANQEIDDDWEVTIADGLADEMW